MLDCAERRSRDDSRPDQLHAPSSRAVRRSLFPPAVGTPARSALIMCARALRASLEPVTPPLRNARRDTGSPAAASLRATMRARSNCSCAGRGPDPEIAGLSRGPGWGSFWSRLADRSRSASGRLRSGPSWSGGDQDTDCRTAGGPVRLSGVSSASARSMCASAVPMARTRTGQPGAQRVRGVGFDADRQRDGGVQVQRGPDARQRGDQAEPGLLRDADPPGPHLGRSRDGQDQQRPGPHGPARPAHCRGPVRDSWSGGPHRTRTTRTRVRGGGRADGDGSHAGHHPSVVPSGWGSPVSAASAAATSARLART